MLTLTLTQRQRISTADTKETQSVTKVSSLSFVILPGIERLTSDRAEMNLREGMLKHRSITQFTELVRGFYM